MPVYDYSCGDGHTVERREGYETVSINCPYCGQPSYRRAVYREQYTRTESGGMQGKMGRAGTLSEGAERFGRNSNTIKKETGVKSGLGLR